VTVERPSQTSIDQARRDLGIGANTPLFVHVGNIRPHKGHSNLTEAVVLLVKNRPDSVVVSIGGEKREGDLDRVRQRAIELGLEYNLRFLGRRNDALVYFAAADVVVNPSDIEGLPLSILEALALARPVVATAVGGVPSVVRNEETGILVDPGSPRQLADAMLKALESPEAPKWGQAGARLVKEKHGLDQMVAAYEEIYRGVLHG
jgi:glycosyltransferase involved in cell wall biosynthesis